MSKIVIPNVSATSVDFGDEQISISQHDDFIEQDATVIIPYEFWPVLKKYIDENMGGE